MLFNHHSLTESLVAPGCVLTVILAVPSAGLAVDIHVPGDQPTIQAAINVAVNGEVVIVAEGVHPGPINFLGKAITVRSTDPTDPVVVAATIINGGGGAGNVVTCAGGEGSDSVLSGFVITGGSDSNGGGMFNTGSPTVTTARSPGMRPHSQAAGCTTKAAARR